MRNVLLIIIYISLAATALFAEEEIPQPCEIDTILQNLTDAANDLNSYSCDISYKFVQPLFESETLRTGNLYYQQKDDLTFLTIIFETIKQDDADTEQKLEKYFFDGVWLTHLDYQIKHAKKYQQAEPNQPLDAFELASRNFPIIGFSKTETLEQDFRISLIEKNKLDSQNSVWLHLKVKPDTKYSNDYQHVDFWIDQQTNLPNKILALTTESDIYEIKLTNPKINEDIPQENFNVQIPTDFDDPEIVPLETEKAAEN